MTDDDAQQILTIACPDVVGIVAAVGTFLAERGAFILESNHFGDLESGMFFMRTVFRPEPDFVRSTFRAGFEPIAERFAMQWSLHDGRVPPRVMLLVSRFDHCLQDLIYRQRTGALKMQIAAVLSNHLIHAPLVESAGIPFFHIAINDGAKSHAEERMFEIVEDTGAEFVILARYMQILSDAACERLAGRAVNIHHSFLPSFKGARPYHQAHERGVKLIGATAHFVTADLDEGPIISQAVAPVDHTVTPEDMIEIGRDIEAQVLARAVHKLIERRVFLNRKRTVVF